MVIYSFYTWFSFLTWVWVNIFLEIVRSKMATTHIFRSGVRNWSASVIRREIKVFNPQAWDSRLRRESWQVWIHITARAREEAVLALRKALFIATIHRGYSVRGTFCASLYQVWFEPPYTHTFCTRIRGLWQVRIYTVFSTAYRRAIDFAHIRVLNTRIYAI